MTVCIREREREKDRKSLVCQCFSKKEEKIIYDDFFKKSLLSFKRMIVYLLLASLEGALASLVALEGVLDPLPVNEVPPGSDVLRTTVLAIDVVSVLPNIDDEKSLALAFDGRVGAIMAALDAKLAIVAEDQEDPTTAKVADSSCGESLLELVKAAEAGVDLLLELVAHFVGGLVLGASHAKPVEVMVEQLASLVAHGTSRSSLHDGADGLVLELCRSSSKFSQLGGVALVVLLIVELHSLGRDVRLKSILGIRKFNSSVSGHSCLSYLLVFPENLST